MRSKSDASSNSGVVSAGVIQIMFIAMKLCGVIDWSWWFVLMPTWGTLLIHVIIFAIYLIARLITLLRRR